MRPCEYFERLISDNADSSLTEREQLELSQHLRECPACRKFAGLVTEHQRVLQTLPVIPASRPLSAAGSPRRSGVLSRIWHARIAVPVPVAAAAVLVLLSVAVFSVLAKHEPAIIDQPVSAGSIDYVQVETVSPATAVRTTITPSDTE